MCRHSELFRQIKTQPNIYRAIRSITHREPILVFWVTPDCRILDARDAHHANPPGGDRSALIHRTHKGHLRGRSAFIGDVLYIVVYGDCRGKRLSHHQRRHLFHALSALRQALASRGVDQVHIEQSILIDEWGRTVYS